MGGGERSLESKIKSNGCGVSERAGQPEKGTQKKRASTATAC